MTAPTIEPVGVAAGPLLAALQAQCFAAPWSPTEMAELLAGPGVFALLAATAGTPGDPLGFILCRLAADEAEILSLGVTPDARRQGCAVALVEAAMRHAAVHGARRLYLEVAEDNAAARALYRSSGFEAVGRREAYYRRSEGALAAIVLARSLEPDMAAP